VRPDSVALIGARYLDQSRAEDVVDQATLGHTAQLITEIAIRWAKNQPTPPDQEGSA
jgi:hypothetical protein